MFYLVDRVCIIIAMRKLEIRTSYNVLLMHQVDSMSKWSRYVMEHISADYKENWEYTDEDDTQLKEHAKKRQVFNWGRETDILTWAHEGFDTDSEFLTLLPHLRFFEERKNKKGETLKQVLLKALKAIELLRQEIALEMEKVDFEKYEKAFSPMIRDHQVNPDLPLPCYLTYSPAPEFSQGGANGDGLHTEVVLGRENTVARAASIISHEYSHKLLPFRYYFFALSEQEQSKYPYNKEIERFYSGYLADFLDEILIYSINEVLMDGESPEEKSKYYSDQAKGGQAERHSQLALLWKGVALISPLVESLMKGRVSIEDFEEQLHKEFFQFIES